MHKGSSKHKAQESAQPKQPFKDPDNWDDGPPTRTPDSRRNGNSHKYPDCFDVWMCCNIRWSKYSELIDHLEHYHFLYNNSIKNNEQVRTGRGKPYRYICVKCHEKLFSFNGIMRHFIDAHVKHLIMCTQCVVMLPERIFYTHLYDCNIVDSEINKKSTNSRD